MGDFLYYSTQTIIAHEIAEQFYAEFYAYCATEFDPDTNPGSSSPYTLYKRYREIVERNDRGDYKIQEHKEKLQSVALTKLIAGKINANEFDEIFHRTSNIQVLDFIPILYLILKERVSDRLIVVPIEKRANEHSEEYIIPDMKAAEFEMIRPKIEVRGL